MTASELLSQALVALDAKGRSWRCRGRREWTSDEPQERAYAVEHCAGCPVLELCEAAATETKERFGVWAGRDLTPTTRQKKAS